MNSKAIEIFEDKVLVERIKNKLPHLFSIAELESSRAGKIGMEVGLVWRGGEILRWQIKEKTEEFDVRIAKRF